MITLSTSNAGFAPIALAHAGAYAHMQAQDFIKLAYQHANGCEHMVRMSPEIARWIENERESGDGVHFEPIGNGYVRAHLSGAEASISSDLLARMFVTSAKMHAKKENALENALCTLSDLAAQNRLPVSACEMETALSAYRAMGCPAVHHSDRFRESYSPHYRVLNRFFADYAEVFTALDRLRTEKPGAIIAIDGMCASGKTTLARYISEVFDAPVYHMDDFFLRPEMRTEARLNEPGGNVDRERFYEEILAPLSRGERFTYRPFDCSTMSLGQPIDCTPAPLNIVEGAYSCHPDLIGHYDFIVCIAIDKDLQVSRIRRRNGDTMLRRFVNEWIPMENRYLDTFCIADHADLAYQIL